MCPKSGLFLCSITFFWAVLSISAEQLSWAADHEKSGNKKNNDDLALQLDELAAHGNDIVISLW